MAFEGTPVTLTVTPDSDSVFKTGSLTYNGSVIANGPPYTFTLSGLDVTVGAEFIQFARYVRAGGSGDGTSWDNASGDLQEMMDELEAIPSSDYTGPRIVKVAAGTYKPAWEPMVPSVPGGPYAYTPGGQDSAFILRQGVQVWGGYPASGGDDGSRNPSTHVTTLSGDIDGDNTLNGNTYHVVVGVNLPAGSGAVLGGLTITGGPHYTFTLSGLDVTVGAEFIQFVRYVRAGGSGDGTSWANASGDVQKMMDGLAAIDPVYTGPRIVKVAAGTYKPAWEPMVPSVPGGPYAYTPGGRGSAFILRQGVQVWGGYPASGGDDGSRNPSTHVTTLSGDIDGDNTLNGNAYHVVVGVNLPAGGGTVLGGLTITGGNASDSGGGVTVDGTALNRQYGGGMYNDNSSPILISVTISGNFAYDGAGMNNNNNSSPALVNVLISGNKADSGGGGIKAVNSTPILTNVTISGNRAGYRGAGIYNDGSSLQINNSIIWGNGGGGYPGIFTDFGSPAPAITYSIVEESGGGTSGNVAAPGSSPFIDWKDPSAGGWAATTEGNYRLDGSAGVNAGNDTLYPENADDISVFPSGLSDAAKAAVNGALAKDLAGANRRNGTIDMGAYEKN
jgi:hypothetical protein